MANLQWNGDDFRNSQDSSGATSDLVSHSGKLQQGYRHGSLTRGLVAYYPMEKGEGEILHDGALNNTGQINGATWNGSGKTGSRSISFDGSDDYTRTGNWSASAKATVSMWVKVDGSVDGSNNPNMEFFDGTDKSGSKLRQFSVGFGNQNNSAGFEFLTQTSGGSYESLASNITTTGSWVHVVIVYDGEEKSIHINSTEENSTTSQSPDLSSYQSAFIGGSPTDDEWGQGTVDDVRIYDRALSKPEIKALYNLSKPSGTQVTEKQVPGQNQGGISRYKFNGDLTDSWGSKDGTDNTSAGFVDGVFGQAKDFDGTDDYVEVGDKSTLDFSDGESFSLCAWVNPDDVSTRHYIMAKRDGGADLPGYLLEIDGVFEFFLDDGSSSDINLSSSVSPSTGTWYFVAGVWDGNNERAWLYVNGIEESSNSVSLGSLSNNQPFRIGLRSDGSNPWDGAIDDVRIYNTALTPQQVEQLYHKGAYRIPRRSTLQ